MTKSEIFNKVLGKLNTIEATQVEAYEGQFEAVKDFVIIPPAIFVDVTGGKDSDQVASYSKVNFAIYLCTNSLHSNPQNTTMLDFIEQVEETLLHSGFDIYEYHGYEKVGNYPGFKLYQINCDISM